MAYISDRHVGTMMSARNEYARFDPLLVSLHESVTKFRNGEEKNSCHLIGAIAEILDAKLTETERTLAADVLIGLIKQAEDDVRRNLASRLAPRKDLHPSLLHYLAYDDITVAEPVLLHSPMLGEMDLLYIIESTAKDHWRAIARREKISDRVVTSLVSKQDDKTAINLLSNGSIEIATPVLKKMAIMASESNEVAYEFLNYKTLPRELAVNIYWHVTSEMRKEISKKFGANDTELDKALEDCVQDFSDTMLDYNNMRPSCLMHEVADMYASENKITDKLLVDSLRRRQGRFFISLFARKTNLSYDLIWNMMRQIGGQGLAVACRAMNISKENFVSIFLLSRTIARSTQAVNADELRMAMRYYDGLTLKMAKEILQDSIAK